VLVELGLVEQRHQAVLEVLAGSTVGSVALRYGVARQTVHRWLRRYADGGLAGLVDQPSRPATCPHQMAPAVEARIVELRLAHPGWGPRTLGHRLALEGVTPLPGRSSIYRALVRHRLIEPHPRRRKRADYRRWERSRAMELWQMDIMGGVRLTDGRELKVITGIDDHSRYCVSAALALRATARPVCEALLAALERHGAPEQLLTDNGKVFTARFGRGTGEVLFDRLCREHGIRHLLTAPRSPTTTGKVERFHKTVRAEFLGERTFASLEEAQAALDAWVAHYNSERPHQGIGMVAPAERFALAHPEPVARLTLAASHEEAEAPEEPVARAVTRRVSLQGRISLAGYPYHVGVWLAGEVVEVDLRPDGLLEIVHRGVLVACHARRHSAAADPASWPHKERAPRGRAQHPRPQTAGRPVLRMVDKRGAVSFAGTTYRVGIAQARQQVEVRVVGDTVQISQHGRLVRTHAARHDRSKEHGAFATPAGRPRRPKVSQEGLAGVAELLEPICNAGTGT
jgi:transposase InsO family protein